ncbi:uncharacterized protein LOC106363011 [Brassica napus]|nr:uncharacterized protein LOC106363011 [Brassica napus]
MITRINSVPPPVEEAGSDCLLWRHRENDYKAWFSSKNTWNQIRRQGDTVEWSKLIWFSHTVPRDSFIAWLAIRNRLSTGDHTQIWGEHQSCRLCGEPNESRDHLFFVCPYSYTIWTELTSSLLPRPNPDWGITVTMLLSPRRSNTDSCLLRLSFQAVIHSVWRERNSRKHTGVYRTAQQLTRFIDKTIRNRSSLRYKSAEKCSALMIRWMGRNE